MNFKVGSVNKNIKTHKRIFTVGTNRTHLKPKEEITMFGLGLPEILLIALVILLLFGGKKIPEMMKGLGMGVKSFKDGMNGVESKEGADKKDVKSDAETKDAKKEA